MKWEIFNLGEVSKSIQTGPFGSQLHQSDYSEEGYPVIMPKDLIEGHISEASIARVSKKHVERLCKHKTELGDIIYSRRGDVGRCAFVTDKETGWLCGTGCIRVTIDKSKAVSKYVFYYLQTSESIGWVENHAIGSTMLNLNTSILSGVPLKLPPKNVQNKIVDVLSAYDCQIENNQKQIKLLEEAAQRLYKEWFIDLRFPGYENTSIVNGIPEGWYKDSIGNLISKIERTKQIKTSDYCKYGAIPIIDQSTEFIAGYTDDKESLNNIETPVIVFGDHTRILKYIQFPFAKGADGTQLLVSNNSRMPQSLFYCSLCSVDLSNYHYARHFKYLKAESIIIPSQRIADKFDNIVSPIFAQIQILRDKSNNAKQARDRLLPKLMSGEIEV